MPSAAAYIRVSTEDQTEYSPAAQLEEILAFARKNGFSVPDEFRSDEHTSELQSQR